MLFISTALFRRRCAYPAIARGDRESRPGEVVGEIGLLGGDGHTMSVRVTGTATVLALGRMDFAALLARHDDSAFRLKRRLATQLTARLRNQLRQLAVSLGGEGAGPPTRTVRLRVLPNRSTAAHPTASTCVAWRPSTTSIRWRSGAS